MANHTNRFFKFFLTICIAMLFWMAGLNFYRDNLANGDEGYKNLKLFTDVIRLIEKNYVETVDKEELIQKAIQGMVRSLDPHSSFLPPKAFEELQVDTHGEFGGIGIVITMKDGILTVVSPIEGTPAYQAGIQAMDRIIKVDGEPTQDMELWEAVSKMRGEEGTRVTITILREGESEPIDFPLVRDTIPIESVKAIMIEPGFGYIWLTNFRDNTTDDLIAALEDFKSNKTPLKGLILDLRDNPGGLLNQAVSVSDLFLDSGDIVSIKGRGEASIKTYNANSNVSYTSFPMVVLINGGSASASEIVAGALQDNKRALILGTVSFGKGSVQTVESLRDGYGLKYTIARYYTPMGKSIQAEGIHPDIVVLHRYLDQKLKTDKKRIKEKDLKNHLGAEPNNFFNNDKDNESEKESGNHKKRPDTPDIRNLETRHGPLKLEQLKADNQVMRALDMLIGYDIFKTVQN